MMISTVDKAVVVSFLKKVQAQPTIDQEKMRRNHFVIDNLDDRWQKLAFTLYTDIVALSTQAEQTLECLAKDTTEHITKKALLTDKEIRKARQDWFKQFSYQQLYEDFPLGVIAQAQLDKVLQLITLVDEP